MKYYPAYLDLRKRPCLVIGGGAVAERKTLSLIEAGADITVISPTLTPKLHALSASGAITHLTKNFEEKDVAGAFLVIAATDSPAVNSRAALVCGKKQVLVNVAVPPEQGSFIVPSVVERGELLIAVSTSGASPALSKKIRRELEEKYGPEYGLFLGKLSVMRTRILEEVPDEHSRKKVFQAIVDSDVLDLLRQGNTHEAEQRIAKLSGLNDGRRNKPHPDKPEPKD
jgi:precorrin-2 dehydrogenase/sirohydrochlorin ferrochelatase